MKPFALFFVLGLVATAFFACSSSNSASSDGSGASSGGPTGCLSDPFVCPAGQTCWLSDASANSACLNSGPGKVGSSCLNTPGAPTCGDGLVCFQAATTAFGVCTLYCDAANPEHACPGNGACLLAEFTPQAMFHICPPMASSSDASSASSSNASSSSVGTGGNGAGGAGGTGGAGAGGNGTGGSGGKGVGGGAGGA
jgi:hypothetical protein